MHEQAKDAGIEWTRPYGRRGFTANPIKGCKHACTFTMPDGNESECYAKTVAESISRRSPDSPYKQGFEHISFHPHELAAIEGRKEPVAIFVDSMADLLGKGVENEWISACFETFNRNPRHIYQLLTKNSPRLKTVGHIPSSVWLGVSVAPSGMYGDSLSEKQQATFYEVALSNLMQAHARVKWSSLEPLTQDHSAILSEFASGLQWAVIGAASKGRVTYQPDATILRSTFETLKGAGVQVFFKGNLSRSLALSACGGWFEEYPDPAIGDPLFIPTPKQGNLL